MAGVVSSSRIDGGKCVRVQISVLCRHRFGVVPLPDSQSSMAAHGPPSFGEPAKSAEFILLWNHRPVKTRPSAEN